MKKYAADLTTDDKIIDKHTGRIVIIDGFDDEDISLFTVFGYYEDDGSDWTRTLSADSIVRIA
jgi:hypothetical protein